VPTLYRLARSILFRMDAERAHDLVIGTLSRVPAAGRGMIRRSIGDRVRDARLATAVCGIDFPNPIGLAAGFDKSGRAFNALGALGFGFVEIGTVTALAQPGNPRPRVFRLPTDEALLNRMGFNNPGADAVADTLRRTRTEVILGINVGKSKATPNEEAEEDYLRTISRLERYGRYLVVNVSSPNTPGLRALQDAEPLRRLLRAILQRPVTHPSGAQLPVFLKLAPDLTEPQIEEAVSIAAEEGISGIAAVNTTISRAGLASAAAEVERLGAGGLSGRPLRERADAIVARIFRVTRGSLPIIGVGGIFNAEDAWSRMCAGASLVQLYTGFVYGGPARVREIASGLVQRMEREGVRSIGEIVGRSADA
jgi:dihydroorotate dehydrogenase